GRESGLERNPQHPPSVRRFRAAGQSLLAEPVLLHLRLEALAADSQEARSPRDVAFFLLERLLDPRPFEAGGVDADVLLETELVARFVQGHGGATFVDSRE